MLSDYNLMNHYVGFLNLGANKLHTKNEYYEKIW